MILKIRKKYKWSSIQGAPQEKVRKGFREQKRRSFLSCWLNVSSLISARCRALERVFKLATHELDEKNLQEEYASTVNKFIVSYCLLRNEYIPAKRARPASCISSNENLTDLLGSKQCD